MIELVPLIPFIDIEILGLQKRTHNADNPILCLVRHTNVIIIVKARSVVIPDRINYHLNLLKPLICFKLIIICSSPPHSSPSVSTLITKTSAYVSTNCSSAFLYL